MNVLLVTTVMTMLNAPTMTAALVANAKLVSLEMELFNVIMLTSATTVTTAVTSMLTAMTPKVVTLVLVYQVTTVTE